MYVNSHEYEHKFTKCKYIRDPHCCIAGVLINVTQCNSLWGQWLHFLYKSSTLSLSLCLSLSISLSLSLSLSPSLSLSLFLSLSLSIPRERVWWSESSKMIMIMTMSKFMLDECVGGCRGRLLIDIFDHTHCTNILHCLQCRCHFLGSLAALSSVPPWWSVSAQGVQLTYAMYVASKLGHLLCFPIGAHCITLHVTNERPQLLFYDVGLKW